MSLLLASWLNCVKSQCLLHIKWLSQASCHLDSASGLGNTSQCCCVVQKLCAWEEKLLVWTQRDLLLSSRLLLPLKLV